MPEGNRFKEVFIVHSRRRFAEREVAAMLQSLLSDAGYSVYEYGDWDWEMSSTRTVFSDDEGEFIDPERLAMGEPPLGSSETRSEVDIKTLESMLAKARLVIIIHPARGVPSSGVRTELRVLDRMRKKRGLKDQCVLHCSWDSEDSDLYWTERRACVPIDRFSKPLSESPTSMVNVLEAAAEAASLLMSQAGARESRGGHDSSLEDEAARVHRLVRQIRQMEPPDPDGELASTLSTLMFVVSQFHEPSPDDPELPVHPLVAEYRKAVARHVENARSQSGPGDLRQDPIAWRREWVGVFSEICEILYRVYCLPHAEWQGGGVTFRQYISGADTAVLLRETERLCSETQLNHVLDSGECCTILADCLTSLASLMHRLGSRATSDSFQIQRLAPPRLLESVLLLHRGRWSERFAPLEQVRGALRDVPFPLERFACRGD